MAMRACNFIWKLKSSFQNRVMAGVGKRSKNGRPLLLPKKMKLVYIIYVPKNKAISIIIKPKPMIIRATELAMKSLLLQPLISTPLNLITDDQLLASIKYICFQLAKLHVNKYFIPKKKIAGKTVHAS